MLDEDDVLMTRLWQTFIVPENAHTLRFDLLNITLAHAMSRPPDAFEVALLNVDSARSLISTAESIGQTDAILTSRLVEKCSWEGKSTYPGLKHQAKSLHWISRSP